MIYSQKLNEVSPYSIHNSVVAEDDFPPGGIVQFPFLLVEPELTIPGPPLVKK